METKLNTMFFMAGSSLV